MIVPLSAPLEVGKSVVIQMEYAVTIPQDVELYYGVLAYYDDVLALAHAYPVICVYDDEGWNAELPPQDGDVTFADAAFYLVRVHAPKGLTLVTSGSEVSRDEDGQAQVLTVANGPARDFYLVASPKFKEISQTFSEVTIRSYAKRDAMEGAQFALETASRSIEVFSKRYAPYPYTEFDIVATPNLALGIEYPGMTAITTRISELPVLEQVAVLLADLVNDLVSGNGGDGVLGLDVEDDGVLLVALLGLQEEAVERGAPVGVDLTDNYNGRVKRLAQVAGEADP